MRVFIPGPLRSYTRESVVEAEGRTLAEVLANLDRTYPGFRFRIINEQDGVREHIKIFVNRDQQSDISVALAPTDEVQIICALSGGCG